MVRLRQQNDQPQGPVVPKNLGAGMNIYHRPAPKSKHNSVYNIILAGVGILALMYVNVLFMQLDNMCVMAELLGDSIIFTVSDFILCVLSISIMFQINWTIINYLTFGTHNYYLDNLMREMQQDKFVVVEVITIVIMYGCLVALF